ncbi:MAG: hypothetical protein J6J60_05465 [Clostridia bacterium]|nr:hypothetical protein [Clostridia bacterium]
MKNLGIYIHIPFCVKKCSYCDFISYSKNEEIQKKYIESLIKSIEHTKQTNNIKNYIINTIYIGGRNAIVYRFKVNY